jgi:RND family efflux transporter MFP subunit
MKELLDSLQIDKGQRTTVTERGASERARSRRMYWLALLLAVPIGLGAWYFISTRAVPVEVVTVSMVSGPSAPVAGSLSAGGYVKAARTVHVVPRVSGRIVAISVQEGDLVKAGDTIAVIDTRDLEQDVIEAKAAMEMASATLARLKAGSRPQEIAGARARYEAATAELESAARELSRRKNLLSSGAIPVQVLDRAETEYRVRTSGLEAARQALMLIEVGPSTEEIQAADAALALARAKWTRATQRLSDARVRAPITGRVIRKFREAGDFVSAEVPFLERSDTLAAGSPLVTLADTGPQEVTVDINETDIAKISLNQDVEVMPNAYPSQVLRGSVTRLSARADKNKNTLEVRVTLKESATAFPQDLSAKITFLQPRSEQTGREANMMVPANALVEKDGNRIIYVASHGRAQVRTVAIGSRTKDTVMVTGGIAAGERVIVSNLDKMKDGRRIVLR